MTLILLKVGPLAAVAALAIALTTTPASPPAPVAGPPGPPPASPDLAAAFEQGWGVPEPPSPLVLRALRDGLAAADSNPEVGDRVRELIAVGRSFQSRGQHSEALEAYRKARSVLDAAPVTTAWNGAPWVDLATALADLGESAAAHAAFERALEQTFREPDRLPASWYYLLTEQMAREGRTATLPAIDRVRRHLASPEFHLPPNGWVEVYRIRLQALSGDRSGALRAAEVLPSTTKLDPTVGMAQLLVNLIPTTPDGDRPEIDRLIATADAAIARLASAKDRVQQRLAVVEALVKLDRTDEVWPRLEVVLLDLAAPETDAWSITHLMSSLDEIIDQAGKGDDLATAERGAKLVARALAVRPDAFRHAQPAQGAVIVWADRDQGAELDQLWRSLPTDDERLAWFGLAPAFLRSQGKDNAAIRALDARLTALIAANLPEAGRVLEEKAWNGDKNRAREWFSTRGLAFAIQGDLDHALEAIETLPSVAQQEALASIGFILTRFGHLDQAMTIPTRLIDRATRRDVQVGIAIGLRYRKKISLYE